MSRVVPTSPHLLERATQGEPAALSALVCARKERAYLLALTLSVEAFDSDLASDVTASMEELADACAGQRDSYWPARRPRPSSRPPSPSAFDASEVTRESGWPASPLLQQTLLRRWQLVYALCRAVAALAPEERALLVLIDMEGLESDQVAWLLGFREAEIHGRLLAARSCLRARLRSAKCERKSA
jgi:DNA-directed RNA polymerase specialized sigma24 family protein